MAILWVSLKVFAMCVCVSIIFGSILGVIMSANGETDTERERDYEDNNRKRRKESDNEHWGNSFDVRV